MLALSTASVRAAPRLGLAFVPFGARSALPDWDHAHWFRQAAIWADECCAEHQLESAEQNVWRTGTHPAAVTTRLALVVEAYVAFCLQTIVAARKKRAVTLNPDALRARVLWTVWHSPWTRFVGDDSLEERTRHLLKDTGVVRHLRPLPCAQDLARLTLTQTRLAFAGTPEETQAAWRQCGADAITAELWATRQPEMEPLLLNVDRAPDAADRAVWTATLLMQ